MTRIDDKTIFHDVCTITARMLEHAPEIHCIEIAILHALEDMRAQLELPRPPLWPLMRCDDSSDRRIRLQLRLDIALQPRRFMIAPGVVGCKRS